MNRKQRMIAAYRAIASKAVDANLEYSTTFTLAACILAIYRENNTFDYEEWLKAFADYYPSVLSNPEEYIKLAEEVSGVEIEIHWEKQ